MATRLARTFFGQFLRSSSLHRFCLDFEKNKNAVHENCFSYTIGLPKVSQLQHYQKILCPSNICLGWVESPHDTSASFFSFSSFSWSLFFRNFKRYSSGKQQRSKALTSTWGAIELPFIKQDHHLHSWPRRSHLCAQSIISRSVCISPRNTATCHAWNKNMTCSRSLKAKPEILCPVWTDWAQISCNP